MGGEISYRWLSGNDYEVTVVLYRDCSGIPAPLVVDIGIYSASCGDSTTAALPQITLEQLSPTCNGSSTCNGGSDFGFERITYADTITLPFPCNDWQFIYGSCCRNGIINNVVAGGELYFTSSLNNQNVPFNNSPIFSAIPVVFLNTGQSYLLNNGVFDPDGDSLVISLAPAMTGSIYSPSLSIPLTYIAPFTYIDPVTSIPPLTIDASTGAINVSPQLVEADVVVYKVDEYRNGVLVGSVERDMQIIIEAGTNQLPSLTGIIGNGTYVTSVCSGDTLQFSFIGIDPDVTDSAIITWHDFTGADGTNSNYTFITSGTNPDVGTFTFYPDSTMISPQPYYLYVTVKDNACPYYGFQTFCYVIYVNSCGQDVWPGDANSDLQVDMYDLLPIGLAYNNTGPVRPGASLLWNAQPCIDWSGSFVSGVNHKHADCNGDGIVDLADTAGVVTNYGLNHPAKHGPATQLLSATADLYLVASPDTVLANNTLDIRVCLGTAAVPIDSIYGIAFRLNFDPAPVDPASGSISFAGSWIGTAGTDMITLHQPNTVFGFADISMVRTDHLNTSGDSIIAIYSIVIVDNIAGKMGLPFWITDAYAITYSESIISLNLIGDTVTVSAATGISNPLNDLIKVYPVPAGNFLQIDAGHEIIEKLTLSDVTGRTIRSFENSELQRTRIDLTGLSEGTYFITVKTANGTLNKRIMVSK